MHSQFDIIIVGAGPSGSTCALALKDCGLRVALLDKATFPRDKICGDAIPGPAFKVLHSIDPNLTNLAFQFKEKENITASKVVAPNEKSFTINWVTKAYNSKRLDFDNFLVNQIKAAPSIHFYENTQVQSFEKLEDGYLVKTNHQTFQGKLIIGADGANGVCAKILANFSIDRNHHCAAVRAYYQNVQDIEKGTNEFYLLKDYVPGYLWIFPLSNNTANVGFGMLSQKISTEKFNLRKVLKKIVAEHPVLKKRFEKALLLDPIKGFGLPLGSRIAPLVGDNFLLIGDAGSLIDPIQGHGIDKGMWSGKMAAETAKSCFRESRFDIKYLKNYEQKVYQKFGKEFKRNHLIMKNLGRFPFLLNWVASLAQIKFIRLLLKKFT